MRVKDLPEYEATILFNTEEQNAPQDSRLRTVFIIKNKVDDGWSSLAYPIEVHGKTYTKGYVVHYNLLRRDETELYFMTRFLDNDRNILRYCITKK